MTVTDVREPKALRPAPWRGWVHRHPIVAFVGLTYAISWSAWLLAFLLAGRRPAAVVLVVLGGFGPALAGLAVTRFTGDPVREWLGRIVRWRVPPRYYLYALGLPALLYAAVNVALTVLGQDVDWSLLPGRLPAYLATFAATLTVGGALEEPGWRGFALPRLQRRYPPLRATLVLGLVWGLWHVPLYGPLGFVVPLVLAFFYTWLYNRTGSVLLPILLHASFTPAQEHLVLLGAESHGVVDAVIGGAYLAGVAVLLLATRGRLGYDCGKARESPP